ncbi:Rho GTPase-activating protein 44 [Halotydeus destructor]|nr:Rho GTPase-activating protein 44 [Halotydeus destructor]
MKKGLINIKNFVTDINLSSRGEKSDVLSNDLINGEKRLELLKQSSQNVEKKLAICLQGAGAGCDAIAVDKRFKKMPEAQLHLCFQEFADQFGSESVLGKTLAQSSDIQKELTRELLSHELDIERTCLSQLNNLLDNDIPNVLKTKKSLNKAIQDMDNYRSKYQVALRQSHQVTGSTATMTAANKAETLKKDWEEATTKVEQTKDAYAAEVFSLLSREPEFSILYLEYFKLQQEYHKRMLTILESSVPKLEDIIINTAQKPIFGTRLDEHLRVTGKEISLVIETCIGWLLHNVEEEGLFRIPGSTSKVKKLKSSFDAGLVDYHEYVRDAHTVAGTLKSYLRELPEPLLTHSFYPDWIEAAKISDADRRLQALWQVLHKLPKANFMNLCYLVKFLAKLCSHSDTNKMSPQNIAIAMAPSLIWPPNVRLDEEEADFGMNMAAASHHSVIIDALVNYADWFWKDVNIEFVTFPIQGSNYDRSGDDRTGVTMMNESAISITSGKATMRQKKAAPPVPPAPVASAVQGSSSSPRGVSDRRDLPEGRGVTQAANGSNGFTSTYPRKLVKPERPSVKTFHALGADSSSNETVDTSGDKSPPTMYATGSLDRKGAILRNRDLGPAGNRKSMYLVRQKLEKPTVPPPGVPRERPASVIERPSVPPPERPIRTIDSRKKQQSLENLCESGSDLEQQVSLGKLYPELVGNLSCELEDRKSLDSDRLSTPDSITTIDVTSEPVNKFEKSHSRQASGTGHSFTESEDDLDKESTVRSKSTVSKSDKRSTFSTFKPRESDSPNRGEHDSSGQSSPSILCITLNNNNNCDDRNDSVINYRTKDKVSEIISSFSRPNSNSNGCDLEPEVEPVKPKPPKPLPPTAKPRTGPMVEASHL